MAVLPWSVSPLAANLQYGSIVPASAAGARRQQNPSKMRFGVAKPELMGCGQVSAPRMLLGVSWVRFLAAICVGGVAGFARRGRSRGGAVAMMDGDRNSDDGVISASLDAEEAPTSHHARDRLFRKQMLRTTRTWWHVLVETVTGRIQSNIFETRALTPSAMHRDMPMCREVERLYRRQRIFNTRETWRRVVLPTLGAALVGGFLFPHFIHVLRKTVLVDLLKSGLDMSFDSFVGHTLTNLGLLFSILGGSAYASLYAQNESIFLALFAEVSELKALVEQVSLMCQGRPMQDKVLGYIDQYVQADLRQRVVTPSVMLAVRPRDDPLESILYLMSVGVPASVYDSVRNLRALRGQRLGAIQRKLPSIQIVFLWLLGGSLVLGSPFVLLDFPQASTFLVIRGLFGILCGAVMMTMRIIHELWNPMGGAYNVDGVIEVAVRGLESELRQRRRGDNFSYTDLPSPPQWRVAASPSSSPTQ
mmetsp:Transcript_72450/g.200919  ORF Transcript_72450/g.200919 Transcript_72450/m.200919 type:complete len:476 (+) Transcript_72450:61-1488(+)